MYLFPIYVRQGRSPSKWKAGFIDSDGKIVISPDYEDARPFSEGLAPVQIGGSWGAIDETGVLVVPCTHSEMGLRFMEGRASFRGKHGLGVLAKDGSIIVPPKYQSISDFSDSAA